MSADRKRAKQVAESPIADVFESRHPSESEKRWAEETLAPALEKSPEQAIDAPSSASDAQAMCK